MSRHWPRLGKQISTQTFESALLALGCQSGMGWMHIDITSFCSPRLSHAFLTPSTLESSLQPLLLVTVYSQRALEFSRRLSLLSPRHRLVQPSESLSLHPHDLITQRYRTPHLSDPPPPRSEGLHKQPNQVRTHGCSTFWLCERGLRIVSNF
jgi:hypothetical protein